MHAQQAALKLVGKRETEVGEKHQQGRFSHIRPLKKTHTSKRKTQAWMEQSQKGGAVTETVQQNETHNAVVLGDLNGEALELCHKGGQAGEALAP